MISMVAVLATIASSEIINWLKLYIVPDSVVGDRKDEREPVERMESAEGTRAR